jgi:Cdc6-like AAA superfamily ATPase
LNLIGDQTIQKAVAAVQLRSEKQPDVEKLMESFVDVGIFTQVSNTNNQIIYGRRGTGKTHIFSVLAAELSKNPRHTVCLIDARTLGSSTQFSDTTVSMQRRCLALFRDILSVIHDQFLSTIVNNPTERANEALTTLGELASAVTDPQIERRTQSISIKKSQTSQVTQGAKATVSTSSIAAEASRNKTLGHGT